MTALVSISQPRTYFLDHAPRQTFCIDAGRGQPVILLHGLGSLAQEIFSGFADNASSVRLLAFDRPGYGFSSALDLPGADAHSDWLAEMIGDLRLAPAIIVAHSIAAISALHFAWRHPEKVRGIMLLSPYCRPTRPALAPLLRAANAPVVGEPIRRAVQWLAPLFGRTRMRQTFWPNDVPAEFSRFPYRRAAQPRAFLTMAAELNNYNPTIIPLCLKLPRLRHRTMIVVGREDPVAVAGRHAQWLARRLPNTDLVELEGIGHMPHHVARQRVGELLAALLEKT